MLSGMKVKEIRGKMGLTQQELAHRLGVAVSTVARWETEVSSPSRMALTLLNALLEESEGKGNTDG